MQKLTFQVLALRWSESERIDHSDKGLMLESLYGGQFTLSTQLIKPNYLVILPPMQHYSFFRNLPPLFVSNFKCLSDFEITMHGYFLNCTPLSPISITNKIQ